MRHRNLAIVITLASAAFGAAWSLLSWLAFSDSSSRYWNSSPQTTWETIKGIFGLTALLFMPARSLTSMAVLNDGLGYAIAGAIEGALLGAILSLAVVIAVKRSAPVLEG